MVKQVRKSQWEREDDFNPSKDFSNSVQETWIHKQVVKKTGEKEDDFIIEEKPVKIDVVDLHKSINEEAKTTDLKYLLKQLLLTGDESFINKRRGFFGDVSGIQRTLETGETMMTPSQIKATLPEEFKDLSVEQIAKMSDEDILSYFKKMKEKSKEVEVNDEFEINKEVQVESVTETGKE